MKITPEELQVWVCNDCGCVARLANKPTKKCECGGEWELGEDSPIEEEYELQIKNERLQEIKEELQNLVGLDHLEIEQELERMSGDYDIKVSALRKQLKVYEKNLADVYEELRPTYREYSTEEIEEAMLKFSEENLLEEINKELSKKHLGDDNQKMTTFLSHVSGLQPNKELSCAIRIGGPSAVGKDNLQKTSLECMPRERILFVTAATAATLQDDIKNVEIIGFSEINLHREGGANKSLLETIKQITEGGASSLKKDKRTDNKTVRYEKDTQKAVSFGTTDIKEDEELRTRYLNVSISATEEKIRTVNENTFNKFSDPERMLNDEEEKDNWVRIGLSAFRRDEEQLNVFIPYSKHLKEKINGSEIFDHKNPRSQRDVKRILNLTCAMTWIFQKQREIIEIKGKKFIVSEPQDLLNVIKISGEFFDQSYFGMDPRVSAVLKSMDKLRFEIGDEWISRDLIEKDLGVAKNTLIKYCHALSDIGLIKGNKGSQMGGGGSQLYDFNKIYYKKVENRVSKQGIKKGSTNEKKVSKRYQKGIINVSLEELKTFLLNKYPRFTIENDIIESKEKKFFIKVRKKLRPSQKNSEIIEKSKENDTFLIPSKPHFDTLLTPSNSSIDTSDTFSKKELEQAGITESEFEELNVEVEKIQ